MRAARTKFGILKMKTFKFRDGPHLTDDIHQVPDFAFPELAKLSYENHIVGIFHSGGNNSSGGLNFIMSNNLQSNLSYTNF